MKGSTMKRQLFTLILMLLLMAGCDSTSSAPSASTAGTANNSYAFISDGIDYKIIDITDATNPVALSSVPLISAFQSAVVDGTVAYVAEAGAAGSYFTAIDVSDKSNPAILSSVQKDSTFGRVSDLYLDNQRLYIADEFHGLHSADLQNNTFTLNQNFGGNYAADALAVTKLGNYLYLIHSNVNGTGNFGLEKLDISNPASVTSTGIFNITDIGSGVFDYYHTLLEHDGTNLYVANLDDEKLKKITDLNTLAIDSEVVLGGFPTAMAISGGYAYVTMHNQTGGIYTLGDDAVKVIDLSSMSVTNSVPLTDASGVAVHDNKLFVTDNAGMHVYDISAGQLTQIAMLAAGFGRHIVISN
jgi:hypothetical protein